MASDRTSVEITKRRWHYIQKPAVFDIPPCACGNHDLQWSEYQRHVWCDQCKTDFIPKSNGIFEGPVPVNVANLMGISFDRVNLDTQKIEKYNLKTLKYDRLDDEV